MRHAKQRNKLSRDSAHRKSLFSTMSKQLIEHERIETTQPKAKALKPEFEKLITLAKRGDLHARRQALSELARTSSSSTSCSRRSHLATRGVTAATRGSSSSARAARTRPRWSSSSWSDYLPILKLDPAPSRLGLSAIINGDGDSTITPSTSHWAQLSIVTTAATPRATPMTIAITL